MPWSTKLTVQFCITTCLILSTYCAHLMLFWIRYWAWKLWTVTKLTNWFEWRDVFASNRFIPNTMWVWSLVLQELSGPATSVQRILQLLYLNELLLSVTEVKVQNNVSSQDKATNFLLCAQGGIPLLSACVAPKK